MMGVPDGATPDAIFSHPRLAEIYDAFDEPRDDLPFYVALAAELDAGTVVDVGCGTGTLAVLLAQRGCEVVALDPAAASIAVARRKTYADQVTWIETGAASMPAGAADLVVMTGNVAQVFVTDAEWRTVLRAAHQALRPGGHLVFETRDPTRRVWEQWAARPTARTVAVPSVGVVHERIEVTAVAMPLVSLRHTYRFAADGSELVSDSTLRFRTRDEVEGSLAASGLGSVAVRDAPDRPGLELVFVAQRPASEVDAAVVGDGPERVVSHLPGVAVGVDEDP